jgi:hypothetical protein
VDRVSKSQAGAYKALSLMHLAAFAAGEKKSAEEVKLLDEAAKAAPDPLIGDAARLKSAFALLDTAPLSELEGRLKPLMEDGPPVPGAGARGAGLRQAERRRPEGRAQRLRLPVAVAGRRPGVQARAHAAIGLIDAGSAKAVPAVVKAAAPCRRRCRSTPPP